MKRFEDMSPEELRLLALIRLVELHEENERLKKEIKSRRHQADTWRLRYQKRSKR